MANGIARNTEPRMIGIKSMIIFPPYFILYLHIKWVTRDSTKRGVTTIRQRLQRPKKLLRQVSYKPPQCPPKFVCLLSLHLYHRLRNWVLHVFLLFSWSISHRCSRVSKPRSQPEYPTISKTWSWNPEVGCHPDLSFLRNLCSYPSLLYIILHIVERYTRAPGLSRAPKRAPLEALQETQWRVTPGRPKSSTHIFFRRTFRKAFRVHIWIHRIWSKNFGRIFE